MFLLAYLLNDPERTIRRLLNPEIVEVSSGPELCGQPAWLFATARPSLGRLHGIPILRDHLGVRTSRAVRTLGAHEHTLAKLSQSLIEPPFLGGDLARQHRGD
jgi:hypothetical protein